MSRSFREPPAPIYGGKALAALMITGMCSASCLTAGIGLWYDSEYLLLPGPILAICLTAFFLLAIPIFGMPGLHRWAIGWYWVLSLFVLLLYPSALLVCLADFFGLTPGGARDTWHIYVWLIFLAVSAPGLWYLWKLLRDPWWQPWRSRP